MSPSEQGISAHSSADLSNASAVATERLELPSSSFPVKSNVINTGTKEVSSSPALGAADTVPVTENPSIGSEGWQSNGESPLSGDTVLEEPKLAREGEDEISSLVEGAHMDEPLANRDVDVPVSVLDEVPMEEKRVLVHVTTYLFDRLFVRGV